MVEIGYLDSNNNGISPVIGVILIVAVTVALVALVSIIVFNIGSNNVSDTPEASVELDEQQDGIKVTVLRNENVEQFKVVGPEGQTTISDPRDIAKLDSGGGYYRVIAVLPDGTETVIDDTNIESSNTLSGEVELNPPLEGVNVSIRDFAGKILTKDKTDASGNYELENVAGSFYIGDQKISDNTDPGSLNNINIVESITTQLIEERDLSNKDVNLTVTTDSGTVYNHSVKPTENGSFTVTSANIPEVSDTARGDVVINRSSIGFLDPIVIAENVSSYSSNLEAKKLLLEANRLFVSTEIVNAALSGSGSQSDPFKIDSATDLLFVSEIPYFSIGPRGAGTTTYYNITKDIDASHVRDSDFNPSNKFVVDPVRDGIFSKDTIREHKIEIEYDIKSVDMPEFMRRNATVNQNSIVFDSSFSAPNRGEIVITTENQRNLGLTATSELIDVGSSGPVVVNGNGHTIKNVKVVVNGIFDQIRSPRSIGPSETPGITSALSNITVENADIYNPINNIPERFSSDSEYPKDLFRRQGYQSTGILAGWVSGSIDNITVKESTIDSESNVTGGVVGSLTGALNGGQISDVNIRNTDISADICVSPTTGVLSRFSRIDGTDIGFAATGNVDFANVESDISSVNLNGNSLNNPFTRYISEPSHFKDKNICGHVAGPT